MIAVLEPTVLVDKQPQQDKMAAIRAYVLINPCNDQQPVNMVPMPVTGTEHTFRHLSCLSRG